jgi:hypothetical protein
MVDFSLMPAFNLFLMEWTLLLNTALKNIIPPSTLRSKRILSGDCSCPQTQLNSVLTPNSVNCTFCEPSSKILLRLPFRFLSVYDVSTSQLAIWCSSANNQQPTDRRDIHWPILVNGSLLPLGPHLCKQNLQFF